MIIENYNPRNMKTKNSKTTKSQRIMYKLKSEIVKRKVKCGEIPALQE